MVEAILVLVTGAVSLVGGGYLGYRYGRKVEARATKVRQALMEAVTKAKN